MKKSVLATVGANILGSHLCAHLQREDCEDPCGDDYLIGERRNIEPLLSDPNLELMHQEMAFRLYVDADEIYNFACAGSRVVRAHRNAGIDPSFASLAAGKRMSHTIPPLENGP